MTNSQWIADRYCTYKGRIGYNLSTQSLFFAVLPLNIVVARCWPSVESWMEKHDGWLWRLPLVVRLPHPRKAVTPPLNNSIPDWFRLRIYGQIYTKLGYNSPRWWRFSGHLWNSTRWFQPTQKPRCELFKESSSQTSSSVVRVYSGKMSVCRNLRWPLTVKVGTGVWCIVGASFPVEVEEKVKCISRELEVEKRTGDIPRWIFRLWNETNRQRVVCLSDCTSTAIRNRLWLSAPLILAHNFSFKRKNLFRPTSSTQVKEALTAGGKPALVLLIISSHFLPLISPPIYLYAVPFPPCWTPKPLQTIRIFHKSNPFPLLSFINQLSYSRKNSPYNL